MTEQPPKTLYCAFCGKSDTEVYRIIAKMNGVIATCICNECVLICVNTLMRPKKDEEATK